jgi:hypothetical protein
MLQLQSHIALEVHSIIRLQLYTSFDLTLYTIISVILISHIVHIVHIVHISQRQFQHVLYLECCCNATGSLVPVQVQVCKCGPWSDLEFGHTGSSESLSDSESWHHTVCFPPKARGL